MRDTAGPNRVAIGVSSLRAEVKLTGHVRDAADTDNDSRRLFVKRVGLIAVKEDE